MCCGHLRSEVIRTLGGRHLGLEPAGGREAVGAAVPGAGDLARHRRPVPARADANRRRTARLVGARAWRPEDGLADRDRWVEGDGRSRRPLLWFVQPVTNRASPNAAAAARPPMTTV